MQFFLLGLAALVLALLVIGGFTRANPTIMARQIRLAGGALALGAATLFLVRGMPGPAALLGALGSWLLGSGSGVPSWGGGAAKKTPGQTSTVTTDHLEMELDHDSGGMSGKVLKGMFAGHDLDSLKPMEVALLWHDCRFIDPQSAQLLEAYLDRAHPTWRDDVARGERAMRDHEGRMQPAEAYEILGLKPGATDEDIRRAHRDLMLKLHPDRGGSTYLAAQVNEAKDVLLNQRG
ncbi:DnaJ domain-containing protein [Hyphomicrobium sp. LHD-15]|uniref:DnaJ domain-containing protein n=1 Tax=Hyphomicrobium sp. LHD-15 TaxID=3072142 RepID=UPI00280C5DBD|nr:DnaJ domain-containing protein [Hyphomicrobium sp. LHD-15]MDQ8697805.1 DnaJ domain-containing protein [Hyphomicrobium sp. LHD-15]